MSSVLPLTHVQRNLQKKPVENNLLGTETCTSVTCFLFEFFFSYKFHAPNRTQNVKVWTRTCVNLYQNLTKETCSKFLHKFLANVSRTFDIKELKVNVERREHYTRKHIEKHDGKTFFQHHRNLEEGAVRYNISLDPCTRDPMSHGKCEFSYQNWSWI